MCCKSFAIVESTLNTSSFCVDIRKVGRFLPTRVRNVAWPKSNFSNIFIKDDIEKDVGPENAS